MDNTSQGSEDDVSSDNLVSKVGKPRKKSLVERELETNLTARITSPISNGDASCYHTSRYGRARKLKRDTDFCDTDRAKTHKSPKVDKSPVKSSSSSIKMFASNSPIKGDSKVTNSVSPIKSQILNENISTDVHGDSQEKVSSPSKKPKIYVRKDMIQRKDKEETATLLMNMFSPTKSSSESNSTSSSEKSTGKYSSPTNISTNGHLDNSGVVKILNFDNMKQGDRSGMSKKMTQQEVADLKKGCAFDVGDLAWARIGTYPFWPCIITKDPYSDTVIKKKAIGRIERNFVHVVFFGDNGRRGWVPENMLRQYLGQAEFEGARERFTAEDKKKDPKLYAAFFVSEKKQHKWNISLEEAESFLKESKDKRLDLLYDMLIKIKGPKTTPKRDKVRKDSDVSLSENLYDTLFSEDDSKIDDTERHGNRKKSLNVSEVVTACLDDMAAKTGITKIKKQSHMDRWLQKAKSTTPEKRNELEISLKKDSLKKTTKSKSEKKIAQSNMYMNKKFSITNLNNSLSQNMTYNKINKRSQNGLMWFSNDFPKNKKTKITLNGHSHCNGHETVGTNTEAHDINYSSEDSCQQSSKQFSSDNGDSSSVNGPISPVYSSEVSDEDDLTSKLGNENTEYAELTHQPICNGGETTINDLQMVNVFSIAEEGDNITIQGSETNNEVNKTETIQETGTKNVINEAETIQETGTKNVINEAEKNQETGTKNVINEAETIQETGTKNVINEAETIQETGTKNVINEAETIQETGTKNVINEAETYFRNVHVLEKQIIENKNTTERVNNCGQKINATIDNVAELNCRETEFSPILANDNLNNGLSNLFPNSIKQIDISESLEVNTSQNRDLFLHHSIEIKTLEPYDETINSESPGKITLNQNLFQNKQIVKENDSEDDIKVFEISKATEVNKEIVNDHFQEDSVGISRDFQCSTNEQISDSEDPKISEKIECNEMPTDPNHLGDNQVSSEDEIPISERVSHIHSKNTSSSKLTPCSETNNVADKYEKFNRSYDDPEFLKYLLDSQDALMEEHPHLTHNEIVAYLYRTWVYEQDQKPGCIINDNTAHLEVKGLAENSTPTQPKKYKKRKVEKEARVLIEHLNIEKAERNIRKKIIKPFYNEAEDTDTDSDLECKKSQHSSPTRAINQQDVLSPVNFPEEEVIDEIDFYFRQLVNNKPNIFKGLIREKVCEVCEKPGSLIKCKGPCGGFFHADCGKKEMEAEEQQTVHRGRKKKKPRGRKSNNESKVNGTDSESQDDKSQDISFDDLDKLEFRFELEINEDDFDSVTGSQMMELLRNSQDDSENYSNDEWDFDDIVAGKCKIVDVQIKRVSDSSPDGDFKCNTCLKYDTPLCFVCKAILSPKTKTDFRQRCNVAHCQKYYHPECLEHWPQAHFKSIEPSKTNNKLSEHCETLTCPRHVCHTCVSDDPRGCQTRFNSDKLAKCVRCPAVYHSFTKCLPAGSLVLNASNIVCTRHREGYGKVPSHVNTSWCFLCAEGGSLICCEYCPTSFHPECLKFKPPEGGYMCEDCETGRLPLYGEMVWAKLGHFRWWPGLILHPSEVPDKIMLTKHCTPGEFVVRFFGQYDHYWMNRGRVFRFQEGDSGRISSQKSKIDDDFMKAVEHAQRAFEILKKVPVNFNEEMEIEASFLPPQYVKLKVNKPIGGAVKSKVDTNEANSMTQCECDPDDFEPCGPESECLNRMLLTECGPGCRAGDRCCNRNFEKRIYPKLVPYRTSHRGWGLKTLQDIRKGQFVIEYVGELIDEEEFRRRMRRKHEIRDENFYFLTLDKDRMIDAGPKGNLARFMNHCCEPNCETQKWTVLGDVRVGLFAIDDIKAHTEVTFNYNLECTGIEKKQCACGAPRCAGYIGAKPKQLESQSKKQAKRVYNKKKKVESPVVTKPPPKPKAKNQKPKPRELTEIEKDLLIIQNASAASDTAEKGSAAPPTDGTNQRASKRKRVSFSTEEVIIIDDGVPKSPNVQRLRLQLVEPLDDTPITI